MSIFYENTYLVDSRDVDPSNHCRPSAVLGILQEAATSAAVALHVSRAEMIERYNVFWMLARIWYALDRPLRWSEKVEVRTWHRGGRGAAMYRDFDLRVDGVRVGEAVSTWVLADMDTRKLFRLSGVAQFEGTDGGELCKDKLLHKPKLPEGLALAETERRLMRYSDCDINGHVNNARYADFACDALHLENLGREAFVSQLQLGYLAECRPGERIALSTAGRDGCRYVRGVGEEGKARFDAALTVSGWDGQK
ncbi:acyl-ACP thioesterase [Pseudoflavonifractor sp. BIOML-A6]|nr:MULTISPECIES: acyl-ACP thioesterase domain-containing protein [unclassified Pseudoflavonifractor]MTQ98320.1 acyl-ACP thioesterase [Pseudoflavonifractor sp. BIOML-A16]MTR07696.1 acyl-ACP thioesterase [Pseudoflavonifractor sp. BIOML-A15]MTR33847.1 acyl-ACP thioesterase [Pseudoflavonifractor sp. BIOML-A14]MTR73904.1 acyl-ACP thioesterase [Pseudoflavonifractor sp. BIOML-A18]MTS64707.1 acyl-ACP thioesterase [Pseudoflavonifractor sp. BIOML-A5]MTS72498.1 acyl-ACP thioesterase [Pseudoflavonifracto